MSTWFGNVPATGRARRRRAMVAALSAALLGVGLTAAQAAGLTAAQAAGLTAAQAGAVAPGSVTGAGGRAAAEAPATGVCSGGQPRADVSFDPLPTLPAGEALPAGSLERTVHDRGYLVVGVSGDTRLLSSRDALDGGKLKGFEVELAKAVAIAIFGKADEQHLRLKVITTADRIPLLDKRVEEGGLDMVARVMTMTCERWASINYSAEYLHAWQAVLVRRGSGITDMKALQAKKATVCASKGSTTLDRLTSGQFPGIKPVGVPIHSDCLALWQEGRVDAISGDSAVLAGFEAQDPNAQVLADVRLEDEPVGFGVPKAHPEFAAYLNAVLASPSGQVAWRTAYDNSRLSTYLPGLSQPAPKYGRKATA